MNEKKLKEVILLYQRRDIIPVDCGAWTLCEHRIQPLDQVIARRIKIFPAVFRTGGKDIFPDKAVNDGADIGAGFQAPVLEYMGSHCVVFGDCEIESTVDEFLSGDVA